MPLHLVKEPVEKEKYKKNCWTQVGLSAQNP